MIQPSRWHLTLVQAALVFTLWSAGCTGQALTDPQDKAALLSFKEAAALDPQGLLRGWDSDTDPCVSNWTGIDCECVQLFALGIGGACANVQHNPGVARVYGIFLGDTLVTAGAQLGGQLSPQLGLLSELRYLDLRGLGLQGAVPGELGSASRLSQLLLSNNQLTGALPSFVAYNLALRTVWLDGNQFTGPIPSDWCSANTNNASIINLTGNVDLCGDVLPCLADRIPNLNGTGLVDSFDPQANPYGSSCDVQAPVCSAAAGCGIILPQVWTNVRTITFNFTAFSVARGDNLRYKWALGSEPGIDDVINLRSYNGSTPVMTTGLAINGTVFNTPLQEYFVNHTLASKALLSDVEYYVTVQAYTPYNFNNATNTSSNGIKVDAYAPSLPSNGHIYIGDNCQPAATQSARDILRVCWTPFTDPSGGTINSYSIQAFIAQLDGQSKLSATTNVSDLAFVGLATEFTLQSLRLQNGQQYIVRVTATDSAGVSGFGESQPVRIVGSNHNLTPAQVTLVVALTVAGSAILAGLGTFFVLRHRFQGKARERKSAREKSKQFKGLLGSLVASNTEGPAGVADELSAAKHLCFVITDMESSTAMAAENTHAFTRLQEIHDAVMREGIARHRGYEIGTEGDSFQIGFRTVEEAVLFCMEAQMRLLETGWPREVLKLGPCKVVADGTREVLFRGPRVRMGIHWAVDGTIANRLHQVTKHRVFSGPGFNLAVELGDAASGGQVLMSQDAWLRLRGNMAAAGFPVIAQIGQYKLNNWPSPIWVYEVKFLLGKALWRRFGPLRRIALVHPGLQYNFTPPPVVQEKRALALTALSLAWSSSQADSNKSKKLRLLPINISSELPPAFSEALYEVLAIVAMQFGGYFFRIDPAQGVFFLAFSSSLEALRFCHAAQLGLMYRKWPSEGNAHHGPVQYTPDGRLLFAGPRLAMAIHESLDFRVTQADVLDRAMKWEGQSYEGKALTFVRRLSQAAHGGQVVLSGPSWASVQDQLPGLSQVISLGTHAFAGCKPDPALVMEVMPAMLARRSFPCLRSDGMLDPGFRESPDPSHDMAIVFVKVARPQEVVQAEQTMAPGITDDDVVRVLTAFNMGVAKCSRLVRRMLPDYGGYECKEPEPGKFTLAFRAFADAVRWCAALQHALLQLNWPAAVLSWPECAEQRSPHTGALLWRGLRMRIGLAYGRPQYRKPLNTGRADYFGTLPNLAARVSAVAAAGQILVEAGSSMQRHGLPMSREDSAAFIPLQRSLSSVAGDGEHVRLDLLGCYMLKGLEDPKPLYQAVPDGLRERTFEPVAALRVSHYPRKAKGLGGIPSAIDGVATSLLGGTASSDSCSSPHLGSRTGILARTGSSTVGAVRSVFGSLYPQQQAHLHVDVSTPSSQHGAASSQPGDVEMGAQAAIERPSHDVSVHEPDRESLEVDSVRPLPGHGSPWGSFVGGLTKRMRHMGLPLGRPSPHPLPPEEAEWAARHKKAALEAICRRSAAHVAQAAALESGVRDSLPGYSPQTGLAANLSQVGRQSAPPPPLPFPGQQVMTMQPASSALQHSASSPVSNDLGVGAGAFAAAQPAVGDAATSMPSSLRSQPRSEQGSPQLPGSASKLHPYPSAPPDSLPPQIPIPIPRNRQRMSPPTLGPQPPFASPFGDAAAQLWVPPSPPPPPASAAPSSDGDDTHNRSLPSHRRGLTSSRTSAADLTAFGSMDYTSDNFAREVAQLWLTGRQLYVNNPPAPVSSSGGGSTRSNMAQTPCFSRNSIAMGELPSARTSSFEFGALHEHGEEAGSENGSFTPEPPCRRSTSLSTALSRPLARWRSGSAPSHGSGRAISDSGRTASQSLSEGEIRRASDED